MKLQLPNSVYTDQDVQTLIIEIKGYQRWFMHKAIKKRLKIKRQPTAQPAVSESTDELLQDWSAQKPLSQRSLDELIAALEAFQATAPKVSITLAAPVTSSLKKKLVNWCRQNMADNTLVNFQFDSNLLGGIIIRFGSRLFDWSFRSQILASRAKFPEILRRV